MIKAESERVPANTRPEINDRIRRDTEARIRYYSEHLELIPARLRALDREWDVERCLETGSATLSLFGLLRGFITGKKRWFLLPLGVQSFFLQHAVQGWCPPLPLLRSLGVRTRTEIDEEWFALYVKAGGRLDQIEQVRRRRRRSGRRARASR